MLISDSHRFILMLPEKCATTTLCKRLAKAVTVDKFGKGYTYNEDLERYISKHLPVRLARKTPEYKARKGYLKACFVRNPYDRVYSWFKWIENRHRSNLESGVFEMLEQEIANAATPDAKEAKEQMRGFALSIQRLLEESDYDFNRFLQKNPRQFRKCAPFTHFWRLQAVDFIGHVERFETDFSKFCELVGFDEASEINLNVHNLSEHEIEHPLQMDADAHQYLKYYDPASLDLVNRRFSDDFKLIGYRKFKQLPGA